MHPHIKKTGTADRKKVYYALIGQAKEILAGEDDLVAALANVAALIKMQMKFLWVGFYFVKDKELVLGPFQGEVACTRIPFGKGVCGTAWKEKRPVIVPDVHKFKGHIACSSKAKSEIAIPVFDRYEKVMIVLDIDSAKKNDFGKMDRKYLQDITEVVSEKFY